jgi:hypothetical protein
LLFFFSTIVAPLLKDQILAEQVEIL